MPTLQRRPTTSTRLPERISTTRLPEPPKRRRQHKPKPLPAAVLQTRAQVASMLNCSPQTLVNMEKAGTLRAIKLTSGRSAKTYYLTTEVEALLANGEVTP
jgi:hypothetical protein